MQRQTTRKKEKLEKRKAISFDVDSTLADTTKRWSRARDQVPSEGGPRFWNIFMSGDNYYLDQPIPLSRDFVQAYADADVAIIYLSGRRAGTEEQTRQWLRQHGYPEGSIYHRPPAVLTKPFKTRVLRQLKKEYDVLYHIGDSIVDDIEAAKAAGVPAIHVPPGQFNLVPSTE